MNNFHSLLNKQQAFFQKGDTKDLSFRLEALQKLRNGIQKYEKGFVDALKSDLNKSEFEAYSTEIGIVLEEINFTLKRLSSWIKPQKVKTPITHLGSKGIIYSEPYGVALIISPWNYPFQLTLAPLIGSIAAGNCSVLKPSELTPKTSEIIEQLICELFPEDYITVVQGDAKISTALLREKWNYIFFTGSVPVGKIIMEAAAKNLTPVTLELGGKSPCIVHNDANAKLTAKRIAWGKFMNAGQTCVAPDYLYLHEEIKDQFLTQLEKAIKELYGTEPLNNPNYTHIVSSEHFKRLEAFLNSGKLFFGGKTSPEQLAIEPTVLTNITWKDPVMEDEIFGPILPILEYNDLNDVIEQVNSLPNPLALYLFSESKQIQQKTLNSISFGGGCLNDTVYHIASPYLPFGGVGNSGIGAYHGKGSFDTFSHKKSILKQTTAFDIPIRYPNVKNGLKKIKWFMK